MLVVRILQRTSQYTFPSGQKKWLALCECHCGTRFEALESNVTSGNTTSCGCTKVQTIREKLVKHGMADHPLYNVWNTMRSRCNNPKHIQYKDYGGRGITYCERWELFQNFLDDMGIPHPRMQLDRIDNDGPYCKENCRWVTCKENSQHKRTTRYLSWNGVTKSSYEWELETGIPAKELQRRIDRGWDTDRAFTKPCKNYKPRAHKKEGEEL